MTQNELAKTVVDCCFRIHTELGPGLLESIYEAALCYELDLAGIPYKRQYSFDVIYRGVPLGLGFRADIIVADKLLIEIKSVAQIDKVHHKIVLTYMKLTNISLALLINFNVSLIKEGIHRKIKGNLDG